MTDAITPAGIKALRERLGLSQAELARRLDVDAMTVSRWERGQSAPRRTPAAALRQMMEEGRTMERWIVSEGETWPLGERPLPPRDTYGGDWIAVDAGDADDALAQAYRYDHGTHPAQTEMDLFAAAYRAGAFDIA